ncbi:hypothetical protein STEG23_016204 [Scotinomys teguina]
MVTSSIAGWRLLLIKDWRLLFLLPCLDSSSSFPCPAFRAIAKSNRTGLPWASEGMAHQVEAGQSSSLCIKDGLCV